MDKWIAMSALTLTLLMVGCTKVKPYEKELHALEPMQLKDCPLHRFERNQEVYREGAAGGNGGKSGGGCGCS